MNTSTGFLRNFFIFSNEDAGFEDGRKPFGHVKLEAREGKGKLFAVAHNLRPGNGRFDYVLYLLRIRNGSVDPVRVGCLGAKAGRVELEWTFNPYNVGLTGYPIEEFDAVVILVEYASRQGIGSICPLAAYKNKRVEWRSILRSWLMKKSAEANIEAQSNVKAQPNIPATEERTETAFAEPESETAPAEAETARADTEQNEYPAETLPQADAAGAEPETVDRESWQGTALEETARAEPEIIDEEPVRSTALEEAETRAAPGETGSENLHADGETIEEDKAVNDTRLDSIHGGDADKAAEPFNDPACRMPPQNYAPYCSQPYFQPYMQAYPYMQPVQQPDMQIMPQQAPKDEKPQPPLRQEEEPRPEAPLAKETQPFAQQQGEPQVFQNESLRESRDKSGFISPGKPGGINTGCVYLNGNFCGAFVNSSNNAPNPCDSCRISGGDANAQRYNIGDIDRLQYDLDMCFERSDPFNSKRSDYIWWKVTNPVNLNNILYQNNISSPLMFNPAVMMAHYKYRHLIIGIFTHREGRKFVVCGVPGMHMVDKKPFGEFSKWVQADGSRLRYGAFGYWLVYINPNDGKILEIT